MGIDSDWLRVTVGIDSDWLRVTVGVGSDWFEGQSRFWF